MQLSFKKLSKKLFPEQASFWERVFISSALINILVGLLSIFASPEVPLAFQIHRPGTKISLPYLYTNQLSAWLSDVIGTDYGYTLMGNIGLGLIYVGYIIVVLGGYQGYILISERIEEEGDHADNVEGIMRGVAIISLAGLLIVFLGVVMLNFTRTLDVTKVIVETYRPGLGLYICGLTIAFMMIASRKSEEETRYEDEFLGREEEEEGEEGAEGEFMVEDLEEFI